MRIVHVAEVSLGGVGAYLGEISAHQVRTLGEDNVLFVVPEGTAAYLPTVPASRIVTFRRTGRDPGSLARFVRAARAAIRRERPDIVHLHSTFAGALLRPWLARQRPRPLIVYCPHGWAFSMDASNARRMAYAEVERILAKRTDLIVVNSRSEHRLAAHYRIGTDRMVAIMNGIASAPMGADDDAERSASGPLQIGFIGRFDQQKGLDLLLDAAERVPRGHIHLHLVGAGNTYGAGGASRLERVDATAHGWLSREDVFGLLRRLDAVVMPSRWEAQGLVALEAMRSGLAVIASDRGGLPEVVRDGVNGLIFEPDDPDALPRILSALDRSELRRMGDAGRRRFCEEFTSDRMNARLDEAYRGLMATAHDRGEFRASAAVPAPDGPRTDSAA